MKTVCIPASSGPGRSSAFEVAQVVVDFVTPFRERTLELLDDQAYLTGVLKRGAEQASVVAEATLRDVYQRVGFVAAGR